MPALPHRWRSSETFSKLREKEPIAAETKSDRVSPNDPTMLPIVCKSVVSPPVVSPPVLTPPVVVRLLSLRLLSLRLLKFYNLLISAPMI
jgi:hypothetical protein